LSIIIYDFCQFISIFCPNYHAFNSLSAEKSVSSPEEAGMKAAQKASEEIMAEANAKAKLLAKLEAKKEIDKLLNLQPLPGGTNETVNRSRYIEDDIRGVITTVLKSKKKITAAAWTATGESLSRRFSTFPICSRGQKKNCKSNG
jgi:hypothetical protein